MAAHVAQLARKFVACPLRIQARHHGVDVDTGKFFIALLEDGYGRNWSFDVGLEITMTLPDGEEKNFWVPSWSVLSTIRYLADGGGGTVIKGVLDGENVVIKETLLFDWSTLDLVVVDGIPIPTHHGELELDHEAMFSTTTRAVVEAITYEALGNRTSATVALPCLGVYFSTPVKVHIHRNGNIDEMFLPERVYIILPEAKELPQVDEFGAAAADAQGNPIAVSEFAKVATGRLARGVCFQVACETADMRERDRKRANSFMVEKSATHLTMTVAERQIVALESAFRNGPTTARAFLLKGTRRGGEAEKRTKFEYTAVVESDFDQAWLQSSSTTGDVTGIEETGT